MHRHRGFVSTGSTINDVFLQEEGRQICNKQTGKKKLSGVHVYSVLSEKSINRVNRCVGNFQMNPRQIT